MARRVAFLPASRWGRTSSASREWREYRTVAFSSTWDRNSRPRYGHVQLANARIELMEPVGGESRWRDYLAKNGQGIEHLGFAVADVKAAKERFLKAGGKLIMIPVNTVNWAAHIPTDAPDVVKSLLTRLKSG